MSNESAVKAPTTERIVETADLIMDALAARHGDELRSDLRQLRESLFAELRRRMTVPLGRRRSLQLDQAEELRRQGKSFHEIASILEPAYRDWGTYQRQECRERLKQGLRARKKRSLHSCPPTNPPQLVSPTVG